jgi:hypothetical protein
MSAFCHGQFFMSVIAITPLRDASRHPFATLMPLLLPTLVRTSACDARHGFLLSLSLH